MNFNAFVLSLCVLVFMMVCITIVNPASTLQLYLKTGDPHFNVIIVDFDSNDIDIEAALQRSDLKRLASFCLIVYPSFKP